MNVKGNLTENSHRILIVDDEISIHKLLSTYLRKYNYLVENCIESQYIVDRVKSFKPDLILLDLMMPTLDGVSATRRVRNLELESYLPIIILTAKKEIRDMVTALEAGADDYITKPFEFEELTARIKNMLRLKTLQDRLMLKTRELNEANLQIGRLNHVLVQTNKQLQKKLYDFHNLFEVSYRVMGQLEFDKIVKQALINILGLFTTKNVMLLLASKKDNGIFEVVDAKGYRQEQLQQFFVQRHDRIIHYLEIVKKAFQVSSIPEDFQDIIPLMRSMDIEVISPLLLNDEIFGLLCLGANFKEEAYGSDSLETLGILTNMMTIAIHNAQMYEHIKNLSYTDGMTALHNYRFFRLRIKEEISRARRVESPVSLLIMDVDNFKNYNDTLGHPAGDEVLRKFSEILRKSVRDNDIVARYGGEEFAILLPEANDEGAYSLAERIRLKVESTNFYKEEIQPGGRLTVSIGIATFPDDAITEQNLINNADQALYMAKKTGRNKVVRAKDLFNDKV